MQGVTLNPLKVIANPKGDIFHGIKQSDDGFISFGEAYFSNVNLDEIKGWKKHTRMTLNLIVPVGAINFVIYDNREGSETKGQFESHELSLDNYQRLTIQPGLWMAFQGVGEGQNMLLNIASIEHDKSESENVEQEQIPYDWETE